MKVIKLPVFPESPTNPARVNVRTGEIEINAKRFDSLGRWTQEFVMLHEEGHYKEKTFDEVKADQYALSRLALKHPYSLRDYLAAVREVSYNNPRRVNQAQHDVLEIAAQDGSKEAQELLNRYYYAAADGGCKPKANVLRYVIPICIIVAIVIFAYKKLNHG